MDVNRGPTATFPMTDEALIIRKANNEDAMNIAALGLIVWLDTYAIVGIRDAHSSYVFSQFTVARIEEMLVSRSVIVAEVAGHLVGYATLIDGDGETEIDNFYVLPKFQNRGVGTKMLGYIFNECPQVWLSCWDQNKRAIGFYKALGFSECGESLFDLYGEKYRNIHLRKST